MNIIDQNKKHFICSYAVNLSNLQHLPISTVIINVDSNIENLIRTINLYSKVHAADAKRENILIDFNGVFTRRNQDEFEWVDDTTLNITDLEYISVEEVGAIKAVKQLLGVEFLSQSILLRRLYSDLGHSKRIDGLEQIKNNLDELELYLTPVEKAIFAKFYDGLAQDKLLDMEAIEVIIHQYSAQKEI